MSQPPGGGPVDEQVTAHCYRHPKREALVRCRVVSWHAVRNIVRQFIWSNAACGLAAAVLWDVEGGVVGAVLGSLVSEAEVASVDWEASVAWDACASWSSRTFVAQRSYASMPRLRM